MYTEERRLAGKEVDHDANRRGGKGGSRIQEGEGGMGVLNTMHGP